MRDYETPFASLNGPLRVTAAFQDGIARNAVLPFNPELQSGLSFQFLFSD
jgi:hypothetical protein